MSKYLTTTMEVYRFDNEAEAKELIEKAKASKEYELAKYTSERKERKQKGVVIDEYVKVQLYKKFNDEREPEDIVTVIYEVE